MKKNFISSIAIITVATAAFTVPLHKSQGLSCIVDAFSTQWNIEKADLIFSGNVTGIVPIETRYEDQVLSSKNAVTFTVKQSWKGPVGSAITVTAPRATFEGNAPFSKGESYLVYAANDDQEIAIVSGAPLRLPAAFVECSRTGLLSQAGEDLAALGNANSDSGGGSQSEIFLRTLQFGSSGQDVIRLQTFLEERKYLAMPSGVAKGYFGPLTRRALAGYQAANGIQPAVGYFGPITRVKVNTDIATAR